MKRTLALLPLMFSLDVCADTLFLNLNNADTEVAVARAAALKAGEKLIVWPNDNRADPNSPAANLAKIEALQKQIDLQSNDQYRECNIGLTDACRQLQAKYQDYSQQIKEIKNKRYSDEDFKRDLGQLPTDDHVTRMVISGHDGDGNFYGEYGKMSINEMLSVLQKFPGNKDIQSVYLLGCNSAILPTFGKWKSAFPESQMIVGYDGVGYLKSDPRGLKLFGKVLDNESRLKAMSDMGRALAEIKTLANTDAEHSVSVCFSKKEQSQHWYLSTSAGVKNIETENSCTGKAAPKTLEFIECIKNDGPNCPLKEITDIYFSDQTCEFFDTLKPGTNITMDQVRMLRMLKDPDAQWNIEKILGNAPGPVRIAAGIKERPETYKKFKDGVLELKDYYTKRVDSKDPESVRLHTFYDNAWLAVSNLDISAFRALK